MKARSKELLDRSIAAMIAAIDIYNKPDFIYRAESSAILTINAWELLLKAKWLHDHNNKMSSLYVREGGGKIRKRFKRSRSGNPITHSAKDLAKKLVEQKSLQENAWNNLLILLEMRDSVVHFYHRSPQFAERLQEVGTAAIKNFVAATDDWFKRDFAEFNFYLMPLAFVSIPDKNTGILLNRQEEKFLKFLAQKEPDDDDPAERYSVTVNIEVRYIRSKAKDVLGFHWTKESNAPAIRMTEEQIRERYPWDYKALTEKCIQRYTDFKINPKYHNISKLLKKDQRFAYVRRLDPDNLRSAKKVFYNPNILAELDKDYAKKS